MLPSKVCIENYAKLFCVQKVIGYLFQSNCGGYGINGVGQDFGGDFFFDFYLVTINLFVDGGMVKTLALFVCNRGDTVQYQGGLQSRELGQAPYATGVPNS